jgi:hypothetical protein
MKTVFCIAESDLWGDFLMKQTPVIIVLGLFCYFMYKYFVSQQTSKETTIKEKDTLIISTIREKDLLLIETVKVKDQKIDEQNKAVMELYGKAIEAQNKNTEVCEQLLEVLKDTRNDIRHLSEKIS